MSEQDKSSLDLAQAMYTLDDDLRKMSRVLEDQDSHLKSIRSELDDDRKRMSRALEDQDSHLKSIRSEFDGEKKKMSQSIDGQEVLLKSIRSEVESNTKYYKVLCDANALMAGIIEKRKDWPRYGWNTAYSLLTLGLIFTFGYQLYKADDLRTQVDEIKNLKQTVEAERKEQARVGSILARISLSMSLAYRDDAKGKHGSAYLSSKKILEDLDEFKPIVEVASGERDENSLGTEDKAQYLRIGPLTKAVLQTYLAALELKGRTVFYLISGKNTELIETCKDIGKEIVKKSPKNWLGPHFIGLAFDTEADLLAKNDLQKAESLREQARANWISSTSLDPTTAAQDFLNLAESSFLSGKFKDSAMWVVKYQAADQYPVNEQTLVGNFIKACSNYALNPKLPNSAELTSATDDIVKSLSAFQSYSLSGFQRVTEKGSQIPNLRDTAGVRATEIDRAIRKIVSTAETLGKL